MTSENKLDSIGVELATLGDGIDIIAKRIGNLKLEIDKVKTTYAIVAFVDLLHRVVKDFDTERKICEAIVLRKDWSRTEQYWQVYCSGASCWQRSPREFAQVVQSVYGMIKGIEFKDTVSVSNTTAGFYF